MPVEERLFSLVLALLSTESGLTKNEILSTVQGYRQRYDRTGDNANLERQFERDKDDIRELGVPLTTIESPGQAGNNQNLRYLIPRGSYELPDDISFTAEETTLLNLAAMVWREGSISTESRRAILKLRSLGGATDEPVLGYAPALRIRDTAFEPLRTALERRDVVRFSYLKPGESDATVRTVVPLALVQYQGRWHLSASELDGGARKMFLLQRIVSRVQATGSRADALTEDETARALQELEEVWAGHVAVVEVAPRSDAATRLIKRRGTVRRGSPDDDAVVLELHYADVNIIADELSGFGPEVLVLSPPDLVGAVRSRLDTVAAMHRAPEASDG